MMVFALALAGHLVGDWIVQTDAQAAAKTGSWAAMGRHLLGYHVTLAAFLAPVLDLRSLVVVLVVSAATHGFLDRRWPVHWLLRVTGSRAFSETTLGVLMADQTLHISILAVTLAGVV